MPRDPVFVDTKDQWWHWDETWSDAVGPFDSEDQAREYLKNYLQVLNKPAKKAMRKVGSEIVKDDMEKKIQALEEEALAAVDKKTSLMADGNYGYPGATEGVLITTDKLIRHDTLIAIRTLIKPLVEFLASDKCPVNSVKIQYDDPEI